MVDEPVDGGDGHGFIGEDVVPVLEGLIAGDDQRPPLISLGDELEEDAGLALILPGIAKIVQNQAIKAIQLGQHLGKGEISPCCLELLDHVGGSAVKDMISLVNKAMPNGGREVTFANATGPEEEDIVGLRDPLMPSTECFDMELLEIGDARQIER